MPTATRTQIKNFLNFCLLIAPDSFYLVHTDKNDKTIKELGFNYLIVREIILSLSVEDYSDGPCQDRIYKGDVWMFGVVIDNREIYIKLQLSSYNDPGEKKPTLFCISFHFAEQKISFPYKNII